MANAQILIVEDESIVAMDIQNILKSLGYAVPAVSSSGEEAIKKVTETPPDLVLMDIRLKGKMDGVEAAEQIRSRFNTPVVYLTAYADEETLERAKITQPFGYIVKPYQKRELRATIEMSLYKHSLEEKLKESEERYRTFYRKAPVMMHSIDAEGRIVDMSDRWLDVLGYERDEVMGRQSVEFLTDESRRYAQEITIPEFMKKGYAYDIPYQIVKKNGEIFDILLSAITEYDKEGNYIRSLAVLNDVTKQKLAEKDLRESGEMHRTLVNTMMEGLALADSDENFTLVNPAFCDMLGYTEKELLSMNIQQVRPGDAFKKIQAETQKRKKGKKSIYDTQVRTRSGDLRTFLLSATPRFDARGNLVETLAVVHDITERKRAEQELEKSHEQLRALSSRLQDAREEERTKIAHDIHDELGQTLTALTMNISDLKEELPENRKDLIEKTESLVELADNSIKTVQRISTELRPGILDVLGLEPAIEWEADQFQERTGIRCEYASVLKNLKLGKDLSTAVFRVFQETLTNVARHANATKVEARLTKEDSTLVLIVKDNGKGITDEQISDQTSFGLISMRERLYTHDGEVSFRGRKNRGTVVTVNVPLVK